MAKKLIFVEKVLKSQMAKSRTKIPSETISIVKTASNYYNANSRHNKKNLNERQLHYMTKKIFYLQFFLILLIFVLPPIFPKKMENLILDLGKFNFFSLLNLAAALFILTQRKKLLGDGGEEEKKFGEKERSFLKATSHASAFLISFGLLILSGSGMTAFENFIKARPQNNVILPKNFSGFFCAFLTLAISVLFEESLYRLYLPETLKKILLKDGLEEKKRKLLFALAEGSAAIFFALAHRWQGMAAATNALFCGAVLRFFFLKTKSLVPGIAAHFFYNAAAILLAFL